MAKIARGVATAHGLGIIHRDLKPANILFAVESEQWAVDSKDQDKADSSLPIAHYPLSTLTPKVSDFGLAKKRGAEEVTQPGAIVGTPAYMAPEQADGANRFVGPPADVWALGVILYECLTGARPFRAKRTNELFAQIVNANPEFPREKRQAVPRDLELICRKCLEKSAADRYPSAAELADDLERFAGGKPISVRPVGTAERAFKWAKRKPTAAAALGLGAAAIVLVGVAVALGVAFSRAQHERGVAEGERVTANERGNEAIAQAAIAEQERGRAQVGEKREADLRAAIARLEYARAVDLAHREYLANNLARARELLAGCPPELRRWEWYYVHRLCYGDVLTLAGHTGRVTVVSYSPNGKRILTAGKDSVARVWDAETGAELFALTGHTAPVYSAEYVRDGSRIVTAGDDPTPRVWDVETGKQVCELKGHAGAVIIAEFNLLGNRVITCGADGTTRTWDPKTGEQLSSNRNEAADNRSAAFFPDSPDRSRYVTIQKVSEEGPGARLEDIIDRRTLKPIVKLEGGPVRAEAAAFSRDGTRLVVGTSDREARLWDTKSGKLVGVFRGHTGQVSAVGYSPDGARVVTGGADGAVRVWATGPAGAAALTQAAALSRGVKAFAFNRAGDRVAVTDNDGRVTHWDAATAAPVAPAPAPSGAVCRLDGPGGPRFVAITGPAAKGAGPQPQRRLSLVDAAGKLIAPLGDGSADPTGTWPNTDHTRFASAHRDGTVRVWDAAGGAALFAAPGSEPVRRVVFDPTGNRLAITGSNAVRVWDGKAGAEVRRIDGGTNEFVGAEAFTPDGRLLLAYRVGRSAVVYDADRGAAEVTVRGHAALVQTVAVSPDGERLVTGDTDAIVKVWDRRTGQELLTLPGVKYSTDRVAFSPDGLWLVATSMAANHPLVIWDATPANPSGPRPSLGPPKP